VAARALKLTIQPWEVRGADDFDKVFSAMGKQRPDGLYVINSPLTRPNAKRIADFALKAGYRRCIASELFVDAGGLMSYAADQSESYGASHISWTGF